MSNAHFTGVDNFTAPWLATIVYDITAHVPRYFKQHLYSFLFYFEPPCVLYYAKNYVIVLCFSLKISCDFMID